jgi:hypothetical protein
VVVDDLLLQSVHCIYQEIWRKHGNGSKNVLYKDVLIRKTLGIVVARCSHKASKIRKWVVMIQLKPEDDTKKWCIREELCTLDRA